MTSFFLSLLGGTFKDWLDHRNELSKKAAEARATSLRTGIAGYSDEYLVLIWSFPFVAGFIPVLQPTVSGGFDYLGGLPDWYKAGFLSISFAVFGIDKLFKVRGFGGN